jgi:hypothetical protein
MAYRPPAYVLTTRLCTLNARRHRWVITGNGMPIQTSAKSFETPKEARADGLIELAKLVKTSRITGCVLIGKLRGHSPARTSQTDLELNKRKATSPGMRAGGLSSLQGLARCLDALTPYVWPNGAER